MSERDRGNKMFKFQCECGFCGYEELLTKDEMDIECPVCRNTGDTRTNYEKYKCESCEHNEGGGSCGLEPVYLIQDINYPKGME